MILQISANPCRQLGLPLQRSALGPPPLVGQHGILPKPKPRLGLGGRQRQTLFCSQGPSNTATDPTVSPRSPTLVKVGNRSNLASSNHWQNQTQWHFWTCSVENDPDIAMSARFSTSPESDRDMFFNFPFFSWTGEMCHHQFPSRSSCPSRQQHQCQVDVDVCARPQCV